MAACYAQLRLNSKHGYLDFTNFSYIALFVAQDSGRKFETEKLTIRPSGISVEAQFPLRNNEKAENCSLRFKIYLPTGRELEPKYIFGETYTKGQGNKTKLTEHEIKLVAHATENTPQHNVQLVRIPNSVPAPEGLIIVAYYSEAIRQAANKYGVDPQAVASVIFQEKFFSVAAIGKNVATYVIFDRLEAKSERS